MRERKKERDYEEENRSRAVFLFVVLTESNTNGGSCF